MTLFLLCKCHLHSCKATALALIFPIPYAQVRTVYLTDTDAVFI